MNDKYSRKSIYVANKNAKNRKLADENGLTDNQHEAITFVCSFRHELHCNQDDLFYSESTNFFEFIEMVCGKLHTILKTAGFENNLLITTKNLSIFLAILTATVMQNTKADYSRFTSFAKKLMQT